MNTPKPAYPKSILIKDVIMDRFRCHGGAGDMWPITWADDDNLYGAGGDNSGSPMNFWKISGIPMEVFSGTGWSIYLELIDNMPINPKKYCQKPYLHPKMGVKPASLISINGVIYFAVELHNYGENVSFNRQKNYNSWIITTYDYGKTWDRESTPIDFFTGRLASPHFIQFGKDYEGARDEYVYAYFPVGDDGGSYWENGDALLLGKVHKYSILDKSTWAFYAGANDNGQPMWSSDEGQAVPVFHFPSMTGENHVSYNKGLKRYIMGNYSFIDENGNPRPYHQGPWPQSALRSQLTLFESPEPWGPWFLFYQDDDWGTYGDYQPNFPTKWMSEDGKTMLMVSSGSFDDYNFVTQKIALVL